MADNQTENSTHTITIRSYSKSDHDRVRQMYEEGRLVGEVMPNDTGADIDNIEQEYLAYERNHFWVAEYEGKVVGMVAVAEDTPNEAEIRRLRVDPDYRGKGITTKLMETALAFCHHDGYLKVVLDTQLDPGAPIVEMFDRFAFQHNRTRNVQGKELLDFYLDLYREPKADED